MIENLNFHFKRTFLVLQFNNVDPKQFFNTIKTTEESGENNIPDQLRKLVAFSPKANTEFAKPLKEILEIEIEKFSSSDTKENIKTIYKNERILYIERSVLLSENFLSYQNREFALNPLVTTYESDWKWIVRDSYIEELDISKLLASPPSDFYFLFKRTGGFDYVNKTNVLEFPLNENQYFFLRLFEKTQSLSESIHHFCSNFLYDSREEKEKIKSRAVEILKELIFRMFIIPL
ncbi:hypothetical protein [Flagellimonas meridianipacifica]|uniref:Uncharacterized protein n=1 Tax=Flagellimonas meridianipacifica TaxID=1080225 RepID=A0A2T0MJ00_9FLAO|nr:hypothetical protein [Allomuricauda pacifica]PRX57533.1 hypothetical protein CLV81_1539 [Allomuricauda pacifica]